MLELTKRPAVADRDPALIVRGLTKVASLPMIFVKLDEAINSPRSTNKDLARIISEDSAMAARLLRIANSAMYNFPARVDTVSHAITVIGINQLRDLVLACSVIRMFDNLPESAVSMDSFWRHSVACGIAARVLAGLRREPNIERYFVTGLLHDIGRLIMFTELTREYPRVMAEREASSELLFKIEQNLLGFDHAKLGGLLLQAWQLPERLAEAVACHHAPSKAKKFPVEAAVIHVADVIANALRLGSSGEKFVPPIAEQAWEITGLPTSAISSVVEQLELQYNDAVTFILGN